MASMIHQVPFAAADASSSASFSADRRQKDDGEAAAAAAAARRRQAGRRRRRRCAGDRRAGTPGVKHSPPAASPPSPPSSSSTSPPPPSSSELVRAGPPALAAAAAAAAGTCGRSKALELMGDLAFSRDLEALLKGAKLRPRWAQIIEQYVARCAAAAAAVAASPPARRRRDGLHHHNHHHQHSNLHHAKFQAAAALAAAASGTTTTTTTTTQLARWRPGDVGSGAGGGADDEDHCLCRLSAANLDDDGGGSGGDSRPRSRCLETHSPYRRRSSQRRQRLRLQQQAPAHKLCGVAVGRGPPRGAKEAAAAAAARSRRDRGAPRGEEGDEDDGAEEEEEEEEEKKEGKEEKGESAYDPSLSLSTASTLAQTEGTLSRTHSSASLFSAAAAAASLEGAGGPRPDPERAGGAAAAWHRGLVAGPQESDDGRRLFEIVKREAQEERMQAERALPENNAKQLRCTLARLRSPPNPKWRRYEVAESVRTIFANHDEFPPLGARRRSGATVVDFSGAGKDAGWFPANGLDEATFAHVTKLCGLPRYSSLAFFRKCIKVSKALESNSKPDEDELDLEDREIERSMGASRNYLNAERRKRWAAERITFTQFMRAWVYFNDLYDDSVGLLFGVMERHNIDPALSSQSCAATGEAAGHRKAYVSAGLRPRDFAEILEGVVWNHPGMRFLSDNPLFQERYAETVIVRLFYESNRSCSRSISREEFRRSRFPEQLRSIERWTDMNSNGTVFSYKHFYVIYCKFWEIDQDHDMLISERDLAAYGSGCLQSRAIRRISRGFGKRSDLEPPAAARRRRAEAAAATLARGGAWDPSPAPPAPPDDENGLCRSGSVDSVCSAGAAAPPADAFSFSGASSPRSSSSASFGVEKWDAAPALTYRDFIWFLLSDVDKSTPTAVEYWFRVMDTDSDGVISLYELETWWSGQAARFATIAYDGPTWTDALCQMMDCVRPKNPDFITLSDLKRSGQAAVFVEYFLHVQKHIQNEQRYQQEIRHLHRLRASERLGRPPPPVAGGPGAWSGGEDGGGGGEPVRRLADVPPDEDGRSDWDWYADDQYEYLIYEEQQQQQQHQQQQQQQLDNGRRRRRKFANGLSWSSSSSSSSDDDEVDDDDDDLGGGGGGIGGGGIGIGIGGETISVSEEEEEEEEDEDDDEKDEDGKGGSP